MIVLKRKAMGFTLIEAAVIIMLLSIALIPIVKMASTKAGDSGGKGVMTGATSGQLLSREKTVANTIMEKAIAGDYSSIRSPVAVSTGATSGTVGSILSFKYDPSTTNFTLGFLKTDGSYEDTIAFTPEAGIDGGPNATSGLSQQKYEFPKYQYGGSGVYYKWAIEDATLQQYTPTTGTYAGTSIYGSFMPKGNNLIKAILRVYTGDNAATSTTPDYVLSTYFYKNTAENAGGGDQFTDTIGIILALDVSLSMRNANFVGEGSFDYLPSTVTGPAFLNNASPAANAKLPMRSSSGLDGYDKYAISSPYLVFRGAVQDLFFAKGVDDTITTQYDERYDPCYAAQLVNPLYMADYPGVSGGANAGGNLTDLLSTVAATKTEMDGNCSNPAGGTFPTGANAEKIFVKLPTRPSAAVEANINAEILAIPAISGFASNWGGPSPSTEEWIFGDGCLNTLAVESSTCPYVETDGYVDNYPGGAGGMAPVAVADKQATESVVSSLYTNPGDLNIVPVALSRIEAARTAMLSFVLTIENNTALVDNFRLGLVPFSSIVNDGTSSLPDELEPLAEPNASSKFQDLKNKLLRLNRACNSATYTYAGIDAAATCPAGKEPFTLTGNTNIAQALYYSQRQFQVFDPANNKLAAKLVVLLTDGKPTASATAWNTPTARHSPYSSEVTHLTTVTDTLHTDNIDVYAIGLLTAGDADAQSALNAIGNAYADNSVTYVDSVADLSPIFENIAQQAERLLLQAMKDRYQYLDY